MMYAILCYHEEDVVCSWSKEEDAAVMAKIAAVQERLTKAGKMGASLRLLPTTAATTLRKTQDGPLVIDGPFTETKEQLLGFYLVDADDLDDMLSIVRDLSEVNPGATYEVRPVRAFFPDRRSADQKTGT
ncbi:YciI family protein [Xanthobacter sp. KR7-65]|uniref:YciI family protein n=1 Tax=Xanthobacter sp. KR7-65 TaxID=3156612 RepID=UPI0032B594FA